MGCLQRFSDPSFLHVKPVQVFHPLADETDEG